MTLVLLASCLLINAKITQESNVAISKAQEFLRIARSGTSVGSFQGPMPPAEAKRIDSRVIEVSLGTAIVQYDSLLNTICSFSDHFELQRRIDRDSGQLTRDAYISLANRFYRAAGYAENLIVYHVDASEFGAVQIFDLHLLPMLNGVPVDYDDYVPMMFEHVTGKLMSFSRRLDLPRKPAIMTPALNVDQARAKVFERLFAFRPHLRGVYERQQLRLYVWRPYTAEYDYSTLTPEDVASGRSGQGRLVYHAYYHDIETIGHRAGPIAYEVRLDANSGRILAISAIETGGGGGSTSSPKTNISLDIPEGPIKVLSGGRWKAITGSIQSVRQTKPLGKRAMPITLGMGRAFLRARYDPDTGLVCLQGMNSVCGKPSKSVRQAITGK